MRRVHQLNNLLFLLYLKTGGSPSATNPTANVTNLDNPTNGSSLAYLRGILSPPSHSRSTMGGSSS